MNNWLKMNILLMIKYQGQLIEKKEYDDTYNWLNTKHNWSNIQLIETILIYNWLKKNLNW